MDSLRRQWRWSSRRPYSRTEQRFLEYPRGRRRFCYHRGSSRRGLPKKEGRRGVGDRLGGIPNVGLEKGVIGATELLDAEEVFVKETLKRFCASLHRAHGDAAAKAVVDVDTGGIIANTSICEINHGKR